MKIYNIPKSTIYHFKRNKFKKNRDQNYDHSVLYQYRKLNEDERKWIRDNTFPPQPPLTVAKINNDMNETFGIRDRRREIKRYLKNDMKFSYKKGNSTTLKGGSLQILLMQSIFSSRILSQIYQDRYLISIDEASF